MRATPPVVDAASVQVVRAFGKQVCALGGGGAVQREVDARTRPVKKRRRRVDNGTHPQRSGAHPQPSNAPGDGLADSFVGVGELADEAARALDRYRVEYGVRAWRWLG